MGADQAIVLVVDDNEMNRDLLSRRLRRQQHVVVAAVDGQQALEEMQAQDFDLILLDIMMPGMSGYEVLEHVKADPAQRHIPVVMISAIDELESIVRCIELGAEDYLFKPFNPVLLKARVNACLEKKRLRDQEQAYLQELELERRKSDDLLLNILPKPIADELKQGCEIIAHDFADVTVLFADIVGFTQLSTRLSSTELVELLNQIFSRFDHLAQQHGLEKIKTIGDAYLVVGGVPTPQANHAEAIAEMALAMQAAVAALDLKGFGGKIAQPLTIRIGINTGPVKAGVIGTTKFAYDLWGDTVNTASRMESHGLPGQIQVTTSTYDHLREKYRFEPRGPLAIKGKGEMITYLLRGKMTPQPVR